VRGIPVVYYGTEQAYAHEDNRASLWSTRYSTVQPLYLFIARLNRARHEAVFTRWPSSDVRIISLTEDQLVFARGFESDANANAERRRAKAGGGTFPLLDFGSVVVFLNNRASNDAAYWKSQSTTYCTDATDDSRILPQPPPGFVWADALSGWVADRNCGRCLQVPNAFPKVMRLLSLANATAAAGAMDSEDYRAWLARDRGDTSIVPIEDKDGKRS